MALNLALIEGFMAEQSERMRDKTILRHERYKILMELRDQLVSAVKDYESFETELSSLIMSRVVHTTSYEELRECHERSVAGIINFFLEEETIVDVHDLFRIVRDGIQTRVLQLVELELEAEGFGPRPAGYVWTGLGSEGRDEQTLLTDQDNMIIYEQRDDDFATIHLSDQYQLYIKGAVEMNPRQGFGNRSLVDFYFKVFSDKAVERLHEVGFEKCKGNVMPSNAKWRGSMSDWKERLVDRITFDRGIFEPIDVIILTDARAIAGKTELLSSLMDYFFRLLTENNHVMKDFIESAVLMPTALSFFGNFKVEKSGEHKDKLNLKLLGWAPLILAVRMAALSRGIYERNTLERIRILKEENIIKKEMENDLVDAYLTFVRFRLTNQINEKGSGLSNMNFMKPDLLGPELQERFRKAMRAVEALQKYIQEILLTR